MKRIVQIVLIVVLSVSLIACSTRESRNHGRFDMVVWSSLDFEGNIQVPLEEFQGSLSNKRYRLEQYGFRLYYFVGFITNETIYIDRNGVCYIQHHGNMNKIDCDMNNRELLGIGIYIVDERNNISAFTVFAFQGDYYFHHNTRIIKSRETTVYEWMSIILFYRYDLSNKYLIHSLELFVRYHQNRQYACLLEKCNVFFLEPVCEGMVFLQGITMRLQLAWVLIDDIGFNSFEEVGAFLRAYFLEYGQPFIEELIEQFN